MRRLRFVFRALAAKKSRSLFALWVLTVALAVSAAAFLPASPVRPAPDIELTLLDGGSAPLASLRGRSVLINFWATTCGVCVAELPQLVQLYQELHPRGLEIIGIAMPYDPPSQVQDFVRRRAIPYPIALDVLGVATRAFDGVRLTPTAFLLDPAGNIVFTQTGTLDTARVRAYHHAPSGDRHAQRMKHYFVEPADAPSPEMDFVFYRLRAQR